MCIECQPCTRWRETSVKLNTLLAYSVIIFVVISGFGLTHFYPSDHVQHGEQIVSLDAIESNSKPKSNSAVVPKNIPPKTNSFGNAPSSTSSTNTPIESQNFGSGITSPNPELSIYENDPTKEQPRHLQAIDWSTNGSIIPGQSRNSSTVYLRNEGSSPFNEALSTVNMSFKNLAGTSLSTHYQQYFTITWNCNNSTMAVNQTIPVIFTLAVALNITDVSTFSFDIIVTAY